jgi:hypothetical protein
MMLWCPQGLTIFGSWSMDDSHAWQWHYTYRQPSCMTMTLHIQTVIATKQFLHNANLACLADIRSGHIKHLWDELINTLEQQQLRHTLFAKSATTPQPDIQTRAHSMRRRCQVDANRRSGRTHLQLSGDIESTDIAQINWRLLINWVPFNLFYKFIMYQPTLIWPRKWTWSCRFVRLLYLTPSHWYHHTQTTVSLTWCNPRSRYSGHLEIECKTYSF